MIEPSVTMAEAESRAEECLAFLRTLVETESPTGDEAGNLTMARLLEEAIVSAGGRVSEFRHRGWACTFSAASRGSGGKMVVPFSSWATWTRFTRWGPWSGCPSR